MAVGDWTTVGTMVTYSMKDTIAKLAELEGVSISGLVKASLAEFCFKRVEEELKESQEFIAAAEVDSTPFVALDGFLSAGKKRTKKAELYLHICRELRTGQP